MTPQRRRPPLEARLSHLDREGGVRMVDVGDRPQTQRSATARGRVRIGAAAYQAVAGQQLPKGDVLEVARLAGIMAAKRTPELIPLCHPLTLSHVSVTAGLRANPERIELEATVRCLGATGVEMEALTAVSVAALTVIDMLKSVDPWAEIEGVSLLAKEGGRSGARRRPGSAAGAEEGG